VLHCPSALDNPARSRPLKSGSPRGADGIGPRLVASQHRTVGGRQ
jgi:hypothetical protein